MAYKIGVATGNWSTAASWESVANTPTLHASTNVAVNTTKRYTATFTAPNLTDQSTGVLLYLNSIGTSGTFTVELEENSAGWVVQATKMVNIADFANKSGNWIHIRWTTPYAWASVAADYYRISIVAALPGGTTNLAANSGGSLYAFLATYNGTGAAVPAATDDVFIVGNNGVNTITITLNGDQTCGSAVQATVPTSMRGINSLNGCVDGILTADISASCSLTYQGCLNFGKGFTLNAGSSSIPYPLAFTCIFQATPTTTGDSGIAFQSGITVGIYGVAKTSTTLWYSNPNANWAIGQGVVGNECQVAASVDWAVNDELIIVGSGAYTECERKFIKTKSGTDTFTFSDTAGGAESGLTYGHTSGIKVFNASRNIIFNTNNSSKAMYFTFMTGITSSTVLKWFKLQYCGANETNKSCLQLNFSATPIIQYAVIIDSIEKSDFYYNDNSSNNPLTLTGCLFTHSASNIVLYRLNYSNGILFDRCFFVRSGHASDMYLISGTVNNIIYSNCGFYNGTRYRSIGTLFDITYYGCDFDYFSGYDYYFALEGAAENNKFINCSIGINLPRNYILTTTQYNTSKQVIFTDCPINYSADIITGTKPFVCDVKFHNLDETINSHRIYNYYGTLYASGAGLPKTKVRTVGNLALCLVPTGTSEYIVEIPFYVPALSQAVMYGYMDRDTANSVVTFEIWLPGSLVADATQTFASGLDADWTAWFVSCAYAGTVPCIATLIIKITGSATSEIYVADLLNGTNDLGKLLVWEDAKPATIYPELGDPGAVWSYVSEGAETYAEAMKLIRSACAGKSDGHTTTGGTVHYRDAADAKNRITATCDGVGNRSAVTTDGT